MHTTWILLSIQNGTSDEELDKIIEQHEEPKRTRPDFTEVIEAEQAVQEMMEDPKKAMEEDVQIVEETARKTHTSRHEQTGNRTRDR